MTRVILHAFSTFKLGGPQARFVQLANAFGSQYHHIVAAMDNRFDAGERLELSVNWEPLSLPIASGKALANRTTFRGVLIDKRPDLLISYNWGAIEWSAANFPKRVQQVHVEDGFGPDEALTQLKRRILTRQFLLGLRSVPVVVASRFLENTAKEKWKLPGDRVKFIPNGVSIPADSSDNEDSRSGNKSPLVIGTVTGLRPEKNIGRLIKAFAAVRSQQPARLLIIGDGAERLSLEKLSSELGVANDVEFAGYLDNPTARLCELDLFALSSDTEQLPIAMLEAMAHGVPIIATRVGDVTDILSPISPRLLSEPDDEAFALALKTMIKSRDSWAEWGMRAQVVVRQSYSFESMANQWKAIFSGSF